MSSIEVLYGIPKPPSVFVHSSILKNVIDQSVASKEPASINAFTRVPKVGSDEVSAGVKLKLSLNSV